MKKRKAEPTTTTLSYEDKAEESRMRTPKDTQPESGYLQRSTTIGHYRGIWSTSYAHFRPAHGLSTRRPSLLPRHIISCEVTNKWEFQGCPVYVSQLSHRPIGGYRHLILGVFGWCEYPFSTTNTNLIFQVCLYRVVLISQSRINSGYFESRCEKLHSQYQGPNLCSNGRPLLSC